MPNSPMGTGTRTSGIIEITPVATAENNGRKIIIMVEKNTTGTGK